MLCTLHVLFKGFYKEIANSWEETSYIKYSFMSPLILDRVYIKTEKSRSMSEFLLYHYLWVTEVDAFWLSSLKCPTKQQLYKYHNSNIGNSNRYDYINSSVICCAFALIIMF